MEVLPVQDESKKMPVIFIGHGNPMNAIGQNPFSTGWRNIGASLGKPDAILCISAHWETTGTRVTGGEYPPTIHDFYGFPEELSRVQYPAPGSPRLADEICRIVHTASVELDTSRGFDHGCWTVLSHMFPGADIPVVQLSLDHQKPAVLHFELGRELTSLRRQRVLIVGSGNIVHNLAMAQWQDATPYEWATEANDLFKELIGENDARALIDYPRLGNAARLAIPTPEHYLPMLSILALREEDEPVTYFNDTIDMGSMSMTSFILGMQ